MSAKKSKKHSSQNEEGGFVYSTNPQFSPFAALAGLKGDEENDGENVIEIHYEKKGRNGKPVTLIKAWTDESSAEEHHKALKKICGVGGTFKDNTLLLQGDQREKVETYFREKGIRTKRVGG